MEGFFEVMCGLLVLLRIGVRELWAMGCVFVCELSDWIFLNFHRGMRDFTRNFIFFGTVKT